MQMKNDFTDDLKNNLVLFAGCLVLQLTIIAKGLAFVITRFLVVIGFVYQNAKDAMTLKHLETTISTLKNWVSRIQMLVLYSWQDMNLKRDIRSLMKSSRP